MNAESTKKGFSGRGPEADVGDGSRAVSV